MSPDGGFGFIIADEGGEFFHRNALKAVEFEELTTGTPVVFEVAGEAHGDRPGEDPRAVNIRLAEGAVPAMDNEPLPPEMTGQRA